MRNTRTYPLKKQVLKSLSGKTDRTPFVRPLVSLITGLFLGLAVSMVSCGRKGQEVEDAKFRQEVTVVEILIPDHEESLSDLEYVREGGLWKKDGELYSGYAVNHYPSGEMKEKFGVVAGRKQGDHIVWYPNHQIWHQTHYHEGLRQGTAKTMEVTFLQCTVRHL